MLRAVVVAVAVVATGVRLVAAFEADVEVHAVRLNAQRPSWSHACPPPEDPPATAALACTNADEAQGLPRTGLRLTWELRAAGSAAAARRALAQVAFEAEITCVATGQLMWSSNVTLATALAALASPQPELAAESSFATRVRASWVSSAGGAPTWTAWSAPALFDTAPSIVK